MAHDSLENLQTKIRHSSIAIGSQWYHYKKPTTIYTILAIAIQEATEDTCIVYRCEQDGIVWVRNTDSFLSLINHENNFISRFTLIK